MLELRERAPDGSTASGLELVLPFDTRQKSRFLATLSDGREALVQLERGSVLRGGDRLLSTEGELVLVRAAPELVSVGVAHDPLLFARACYHLGNRHIPLQITSQCVLYQHDHVLDDMLRQLGLHVSSDQRPFEPEAGAYAGGRHHHHAGGHDSHGHTH